MKIIIIFIIAHSAPFVKGEMPVGAVIRTEKIALSNLCIKYELISNCFVLCPFSHFYRTKSKIFFKNAIFSRLLFSFIDIYALKPVLKSCKIELQFKNAVSRAYDGLPLSTMSVTQWNRNQNR